MPKRALVLLPLVAALAIQTYFTVGWRFVVGTLLVFAAVRLILWIAAPYSPRAAAFLKEPGQADIERMRRRAPTLTRMWLFRALLADDEKDPPDPHSD